jgi:hypothetical protein
MIRLELGGVENKDYKTHNFSVSWYDKLSEVESIELGYMDKTAIGPVFGTADMSHLVPIYKQIARK